MPRQRPSISPTTEGEVLDERLSWLERLVNRMNQAGTASIQTIDKNEYPDPSQGEVIWHWKWNRGYIWHLLRWRPLAPPTYHIKVFADNISVVTTTGENRFIFNISEDMDKFFLSYIRIYVTTPGSCTVQLNNITQGVDLLSTAATIDAGEYSSKTAATQPVIHPTNSKVFDDDRVAIAVTAASGCKGLGVQLVFNPDIPIT